MYTVSQEAWSFKSKYTIFDVGSGSTGVSGSSGTTSPPVEASTTVTVFVWWLYVNVYVPVTSHTKLLPFPPEKLAAASPLTVETSPDQSPFANLNYVPD